uniref:Secreted protein n=1 Tax=Haemonchus placei TaxID=6290 RepID=A0A0N4W924_HAEPC
LYVNDNRSTKRISVSCSRGSAGASFTRPELRKSSNTHLSDEDSLKFVTKGNFLARPFVNDSETRRSCCFETSSMGRFRIDSFLHVVIKISISAALSNKAIVSPETLSSVLCWNDQGSCCGFTHMSFVHHVVIIATLGDRR